MKYIYILFSVLLYKMDQDFSDVQGINKCGGHVRDKKYDYLSWLRQYKNREICFIKEVHCAKMGTFFSKILENGVLSPLPQILLGLKNNISKYLGFL